MPFWNKKKENEPQNQNITNKSTENGIKMNELKNEIPKNMQWQHSDLKISDIFLQDLHPAFLAGSGISLDTPSNLLAGYQFTQKILKHFLPPEELESILEYTNPDRMGMRSQGEFLRFEQLMGILRGLIDLDLHILDIFGECNSPNFNHIFLAAAARIGCPIFTTNFDGLIELALLAFGVKGTIIHGRKDILEIRVRRGGNQPKYEH